MPGELLFNVILEVVIITTNNRIKLFLRYIYIYIYSVHVEYYI